MALKCSNLFSFTLILVLSVGLASAQEEMTCYGAGSIAASVILTCIFTVALLAAIYYWWTKYRNKKDHLILETDPEKGKGEYAFDNPGFKDTSILPPDGSKPAEKHSKWNQWSPLSALTNKSEKNKTVDDSAIEGKEVKVVALRSHDFTGLGFKICGNMKEGIYIKDILHRGPAFESGKLNSGDRIISVTISFEHMVYEDALTILSYASPYEIIIEAKSGKIISNTQGQGAQPSHPVYRSSSCMDLFNGEKSSKKRLFGEDYNGSLSSNYSSLQKSRSNMTTLERKESNSPKPMQPKHKRTPQKHLTPEQLKSQLEQRIPSDHQNNLKTKEKPAKAETENQKTENKHHKFGIRVLPLEQQQKSPKITEQNENNMNIEKHNSIPQPKSIDEVDETKKIQPPQAKKREKKPEITPEKSETNFERAGSNIKRDENGIPQEIPSFMMNAAVAARKNRKNSDDKSISKEEDDSKTPKKAKGKAPSPPEETVTKNNYDEIKTITDASEGKKEGYNSDSDIDTDKQSSVNTIELNSSDITIHQTEDEERQNRKTASTGDLTKIQKTSKSSTGTLERAQSLDITDTGIPTLTKKLKATRNDVLKSDEDIFSKAILNREPRLSLILDGLNTFQRNRLKKSTEWGNLEDAILKLNQEDENLTSLEENVSSKSEFDAVVNKINEIKRESIEIEIPIEIVEKYQEDQRQKTEPKKVKNQIWPMEIDPEPNKTSIELKENSSCYSKRQQVPAVPERNNMSQKNKFPALSVGSKVQDTKMEEIDLNQPPTYSVEKRQMKPNIFNEIDPRMMKQRNNVEDISIEKRQIKPSLRKEIESPMALKNIEPETKASLALKNMESETNIPPMTTIEAIDMMATTNSVKTVKPSLLEEIDTTIILNNQRSNVPETKPSITSAENRQITPNPKNEVEVITEVNKEETDANFFSRRREDIKENSESISSSYEKRQHQPNVIKEISIQDREITYLPRKSKDIEEKIESLVTSVEDRLKPSVTEITSSFVPEPNSNTSSPKNEDIEEEPITTIFKKMHVKPSLVKEKYPPSHTESRLHFSPETVKDVELVTTSVKNIEIKPRLSMETEPLTKLQSKETSLPVVNNRQRIPDRTIDIPESIIKDEWDISIESINNTSPPPSLDIVDDITIQHVRVPALSANNTDETKTVVTCRKDNNSHTSNLQDVTQNFLYTEQLNCSQYDNNISDDIKVSRHSLESLEKSTTDVPKSDDAKSNSINISNITVENGGSELHSLELSINEPSELYTTALDKSKITISTPDLIKNVTLTEAITSLNKETPPLDEVEVTENSFSRVKPNKSPTYITEIQVLTPNNSTTNISEVEIIPNSDRKLESDFENYVKNFEEKLESFESNIHNFESNLEEFIKDEPKSIIINEQIDVEKELHKIQEIADEQLKKLPEMRFTTSSYETGHKTPEKRHSFELLRSNFEKAPPKKDSPPKSRIPIFTTTKTPPTSPERRDSKNLENENDKAILELMSSSIHSTPFNSKIKPPSTKNVTVTSIRSNSKIPSGLPTYSGNRPPIPSRKIESDNVVQVSTNGNHENSFKQWVFNPSSNVMLENNRNK